MKYNTILDVGESKRKRNGINEDSLGVTTFETGHREDQREAGIFVIADGAGGHQAGDVASYIATNAVIEELSGFLSAAERRRSVATAVEMEASIVDDAPDAKEMRDRMTEAVKVAHAEILEYASEAKAEPMTTIVAAIVYNGFVHSAWAGDSRAYLINSTHDQISLLTRDHSVVEKKRQNGEISDIEAEVHSDGNQITNALGGNQYDSPETRPVDVDTRTVKLYSEDKLLITSDGLIDGWVNAPNFHSKLLNADGERQEQIAKEILRKSVTDNEIRDAVLESDSIETANETLVEIANSRGGKDNISIIIADPDIDEPSPEDNLPPRGIDEEQEDIADQNTVIRDDTDLEETDDNSPSEDNPTSENHTGSAEETTTSQEPDEDEPDEDSNTAKPSESGNAAANDQNNKDIEQKVKDKISNDGNEDN